MRTLTIIGVTLSCLMCLTPLWGQGSKDNTDNLPFELGAQYENKMARGYFDNGFFRFEIEYNIRTSFTDRVWISWSAFSVKPSPWKLAFEAVPPMWDSQTSRERGDNPARVDEYRAGIQYLSKRADGRVLMPGISSIDGRTLKPRIELRHLRLLQRGGNTEIFARGLSDLDQTTYGFGLEHNFGSLELQLIYENMDRLSWSLGFSTQIN